MNGIICPNWAAWKYIIKLDMPQTCCFRDLYKVVSFILIFFLQESKSFLFLFFLGGGGDKVLNFLFWKFSTGRPRNRDLLAALSLGFVCQDSAMFFFKIVTDKPMAGSPVLWQGKRQSGRDCSAKWVGLFNIWVEPEYASMGRGKIWILPPFFFSKKSLFIRMQLKTFLKNERIVRVKNNTSMKQKESKVISKW